MNQKIILGSELPSLGDRLKKSGLKVVLANGCFDLLHVGHVRFLQDAKRQGDVLVVGINSDRAVRSLKGPGRPLMSENARAELIAALECVDFVTIFDGLTAEEILRDLKPHIQCKGTDYSEASVPEAKVIESLGGTVRIVGDTKSHSTRKILADIRNRFKHPPA